MGEEVGEQDDHDGREYQSADGQVDRVERGLEKPCQKLMTG
jgi:hypothetical protein